MSFINSDSLLSNIKNVSMRIQMKPSDGSNIFQSIFSMRGSKQKSLKPESIIDLDSGIFSVENQTNSFIDKLSSSKDNAPVYHYNWIICKNSGAGLSEDQQVQEASTPKIKIQKQNLIENKINLIPVNQNKQSQNQDEEIDKKKIKNQTKNIPKNYGKAIICFIQRYRQKVQKITQECHIDYNQLRNDLKKIKKSINTIADLRQLWSHYKYSKCMRIISIQFFRKHSLSYIFDSRICTYSSHIKYRQRLIEAVSNPNDFKHIKDY